MTADIKKDPPNPDLITKALDQLSSEIDPIYFLLSADMENTTSIYNLQENTALASEGISTISFANVKAGDTLLSHDMDVINSITTTAGTAFNTATTQYGFDSTRVNNANNNYSNLTQIDETSLSSLGDKATGSMDSASATLDNISGYISLLTGWGS